MTAGAATEREATAREELLPPGATYEFVRGFVGAALLVLLRLRSVGSEHVPAGPLILVVRGGSRLDRWLCEAFVRRHIEVFVREDDEGYADAVHVLARGGAVATAAGGVQGGRLAAATGVAVVPVLLDGARRLAWRRPFGRIRVVYGEPFAFEPLDADAITPGQARAVIAEIRRRVDALS